MRTSGPLLAALLLVLGVAGCLDDDGAAPDSDAAPSPQVPDLATTQDYTVELIE